MDGFRRVESSQTPAGGPQFGPNVQGTVKLVEQNFHFPHSESEFVWEVPLGLKISEF
jgi:hypothetical protein